MSDLDSIKKQVKQEEEEVYGEASGYTEPGGVNKNFEKFVGHEPDKGENIADEVEESEDTRRGKAKPHK
jgi:hypothetical protein